MHKRVIPATKMGAGKALAQFVAEFEQTERDQT